MHSASCAEPELKASNPRRQEPNSKLHAGFPGAEDLCCHRIEPVGIALCVPTSPKYVLARPAVLTQAVPVPMWPPGMLTPDTGRRHADAAGNADTGVGNVHIRYPMYSHGQGLSVSLRNGPIEIQGYF